MAERDDDAFIAEIRQRFADAELADRENRERAQEDAEFESGEQWPIQVRRQRETDGRICITVNRLRGFVRQVSNELRMQPPAINVSPQEDGDLQTAAVIEGLIRSVEQQSKAKRIYARAGEDAARCNMGFWRVTTDYIAPDSFDQEIRIKPILNPFSVLYDPAAEDSTCRDARYCIVYDDMPRDEFEKRFKDKAQTEFYADGSTRLDGEWISRETIRLAEYWCVEEKAATLQLLTDGSTRYKDDKTPLAFGVSVKQERTSIKRSVCMYLVSGAEVLEETEWPGNRIPIIPVWGEEARVGGKRVRNGVITFAKDPQRMLNFWRSATAERIALAPKAPWLVTPKMIDGFQTIWANAANGNPSVLYYNADPGASGAGGMPHRTEPAPVEAAMLQEAALATDDLKATTGIYDASLGAKSNETSGKAIIARQREGDVGTYAFVDNVLDAIEETGRVVIDLIPHIYDTPRMVRILGKKMEPQIVAVNQAWFQPAQHPQTGQPMADPYGRPMGQTVHVDLTVGKYDVTVSTGPSVTTQRQETAELLTSTLQAAPMLAPVILPRLAAVIDMPDADEFAAEVKALMQPGPQGPNPKDQAQAALSSAKADGQKIDNMVTLANIAATPLGRELAGAHDLSNMARTAQLGADPMGAGPAGGPPAGPPSMMPGAPGALPPG